jgi:hypothetical protein
MPVVRWVVQGGARYVDLEGPGGYSLRVPVSWTDHGFPMVVPAVDGQPAKLNVAALHRLAEWVLDKKLDESGGRQLTLEQDEAAGRTSEYRRRRGSPDCAATAELARLGRGRPGDPVADPGCAWLARAQVDQDPATGGDGESR